MLLVGWLVFFFFRWWCRVPPPIKGKWKGEIHFVLCSEWGGYAGPSADLSRVCVCHAAVNHLQHFGACLECGMGMRGCDLGFCGIWIQLCCTSLMCFLPALHYSEFFFPFGSVCISGKDCLGHFLYSKRQQGLSPSLLPSHPSTVAHTRRQGLASTFPGRMGLRNRGEHRT